MTEERRTELVKQAKVISEEIKVGLRNVRRELVERIKKIEKEKSIDKDNSKFYQVSFSLMFRTFLIVRNEISGRSAKTH